MAPIPEMTEEEFRQMIAAGGSSGNRPSGAGEMSEEEFAKMVAGGQATEEPVTQDTLTEIHKPWYSPITEGVSGIVPQIGQNMAGLLRTIGSPVKTAEALFERSNALDMQPSVGGPFGYLAKEVLARPGLTQLATGAGLGTAGLIAGTAGGHPFLGASAGGTLGTELGNQINQLTGTTPDTPIREDLTRFISSLGADAVTAQAMGKAGGAALIPERRAIDRAARETTFGAKLMTPKGTTGNHTILSEKMARYRNKIIELNPFKGIEINDPNAFGKVQQQAQGIKSNLIEQKANLLQQADDAGEAIRLSTYDIDAAVEALRSEGRSIPDGAVEFAKDKIIRELNANPSIRKAWETRPEDAGNTLYQTRSEFEQNSMIPGNIEGNYRSFTPTEAQEYMRRKIDDELAILKEYDTTQQAKGIVGDLSAFKQNAAEKAGLNLLRDTLEQKLHDTVPGLMGVNDGISAMIELDGQLRSAQAGLAGSELVLPGQGLPAAAQGLKPGIIGRTMDAIIPTGIRNQMKVGSQTGNTQNMQAQMLGPIQDIIARNTPGASSPARDIISRIGGAIKQIPGRANALSNSLGGDAVTGAAMYNLMPRDQTVVQQANLTPDQVPQLFGDKPQAPMQFQRDSNVIRQMPEQFAATVQQAAFETLLKQTGSPDVASSVAHRMSREALQIAASPSDAERAEGIAAIAKTLPQAFLPGEYPDEMDGTVVQPTSKLQLEDNAKAKLQAGQVDSITYAKQKQEAFKSGPSRIIIRKSGQLTPAQPASNPNAVMMQANTPNY